MLATRFAPNGGFPHDRQGRLRHGICPHGVDPLAHPSLANGGSWEKGTAEMIDDWLKEAGNCGELAQLHYIDPQAIRRQIPQKLPGLQAQAKRVLGRFAAMCRK